MKTIVTHDGNFHVDDVFAVAVLLLVYPEAEVIRSRDKETIEQGDIAILRFIGLIIISRKEVDTTRMVFLTLLLV
jgi:hypothetical protein